VWQCMSNESVVGVCDRLLPLCHTVAKEVANRASLFHMAMARVPYVKSQINLFFLVPLISG
jgi:hypothetical protein